MLELLNLSQRVKKSDYKEQKAQIEMRLAELQRKAHQCDIPVMIIFEGWDASGKGTLINELILPLDPRGFKVHSTLNPTEEEQHFPFLWRFWTKIPQSGQITVFDRSWYGRLLDEKIAKKGRKEEFNQAFRDVASFERQLHDAGTVIIKIFLHISRSEQKKRFKKLAANPATAWRVTADDRRRHRRYTSYLNAIEEMLAASDSGFAPWTVVEAHDRRFASLKIFKTVIDRLERRIAQKSAKTPTKKKQTDTEGATGAILSRLDLTLTMERVDYRRQLKAKQKKLRELEHKLYMRRIPLIIVYEGCDAAGKGGSIRRLTANLDPRGYEVVPIAAPNDIEKRYHYLWRFWIRMPKAGHITVFDRSWYGRVMVERVEGFCHPEEWRRAYREINEMEAHLTHFGAVIVKFWLQIDRKEQLRRFNDRRKNKHKQWKITAEDWRNREKWNEYESAVEEMLLRTSTPHAPWTIIE